MKKVSSKILGHTIICAIVSLALCYSSLFFYESQVSKKFNDKEQYEIESKDEISDPEGYAIIIEGIFYYSLTGLAYLGEAIMVIMFVFLAPAVMSLIIIILQVIMKLFQIGDEKHWKDVCSKIFCWTAIVLQILLSLLLIFDIFIMKAIISVLILLIAIGINIAAIDRIIRYLKEAKNQNIVQQA